MFDIAIDNRELERDLAMCRKQIPFAMAVALTRTGKAVQTGEIGGRGVLTIRGDDWTKKGIRVEPATKQSLEARIGSVDPLMGLLATGGSKEPGQHLQSVPAKGGSTKEPLRGPDDLGTLLRRSGKWPKGIVKKDPSAYFLQRAGSFIGREEGYPRGRKGGYTGADDEGARREGVYLSDKRRGHRSRHGDPSALAVKRRGGSGLMSLVEKKDILFQKIGPTHAAQHRYGDLPAGRQVRPRYPIQAVYVIYGVARIPKQWPFEEIAARVAGERWPAECEKAVVEALWSTK